MRQVQQIMGMPITIDIPDCRENRMFGVVFERLRQIDDRFSTYIVDSEVFRFAAGKIAEAELSRELKEVIKACREAEAKTDGFFSAWAGGAFDPSGYVKGWAIAEAGKIIESSSFKTFSIGAAGDILCRSDSQKVWRIGIQDPRHKSKILDVLSIPNGAVCTTGNYERGAHIINPKTKEPADELLSISVTGPDIIWSDVLATAMFAMGRAKAETFIKSQLNYRAIII